MMSAVWTVRAPQGASRREASAALTESVFPGDPQRVSGKRRGCGPSRGAGVDWNSGRMASSLFRVRNAASTSVTECTWSTTLRRFCPPDSSVAGRRLRAASRQARRSRSDATQAAGSPAPRDGHRIETATSDSGPAGVRAPAQSSRGLRWPAATRRSSRRRARSAASKNRRRMANSFCRAGGRATEHVGFVSRGAHRHQLRFDLIAHLVHGPSSRARSTCAVRARRADEILAAPAAQGREVRFTDDPAVKDPDPRACPYLRSTSASTVSSWSVRPVAIEGLITERKPST